MYIPAFIISNVEEAVGISQGSVERPRLKVPVKQIIYLLLIWGNDIYTSGAIRVHTAYDPATQ